MTTITLTPRAAREQQTFRVLLNAMARPGSIDTVPLHEAGGEHAAVLSVIESLVDHEVTFAVLPERADLVDLILRQTGSRAAAIDIAGYVICDAASLSEAFDWASEGTLEYPDQGATIICSVKGIAEDCDLTLRGPGIKDVTFLAVEGFDDAALALFSECNAQPPLGLDVIFVAPDGRVACLTRYTRIERRESVNDPQGAEKEQS
ncbi:MAG: phosphonate C-P lyase system protein PhnH [Dehalococcoidia bacterium]